MSRRNRRSGGGAVASAGGGQEVERLLAKGRLKDAFKQAKLVFREQATSENRLLLERTYLLRVKDLLQGGMPTAGAEVARAFLDFGVTEPGALGELAALLPQLGMIEEARRLAPRLESPDAAASLEHSLIDQAVLHPERAATPDAKAGAARIRSALEALDAEQEQRATELLRDIPRGSPWADWRYFARGLAAFRRGDAAQAAANWDRLDAERAAHRIATKLRAVVVAPETSQPNADLSRVETVVFGQPVLGRLDRLRRLVDRGNPKRDWMQAMSLIAALAETLRRLDPRLAERLTEVLIPLFADQASDVPRERARELFGAFTRSAGAWRLDPGWNRLWAVCCEENGADKEAVESWKKYVRDLEKLGDFAPDERRRIQALVWNQIATILADDARAAAMPFSDSTDPRRDKLRGEAARALEESLRIYPSHRETHAALVSLYDEWQKPERAAEARHKLLEAFPDDFETLRALTAWHLKKDEPERSLEYVRRAHELRPLDASLTAEEHTALLGVARHFAVDRRFEEARAAFAQAESLRPADAAGCDVLARRAILEIKAGDQARADELIEEAKATLGEPAPLWLVLAIEAERYKLAAAHAKRFNRELAAALKKRKNGETAGKLADLVGSYQVAGVEYGGKSRHLRMVTEYVLATSRTHYTLDDLERVCQFLDIFHNEEPALAGDESLLGKLVRRGLKIFPHSPLFHFLRAEDDLRRLPTHFDFQGIENRLEKALDLAQADTEGHYAKLVDPIKRLIAQVDRMGEMMEVMQQRFAENGGAPGGLPEFFSRMASFDPEEFDNDDDEFDDGEYDEDEEDEDDGRSYFSFPFSFPFAGKRGRSR